jgi:hypothetical protein
MRWHFAITIVSIVALAAIGVYGHLDPTWGIVALATGHGATQALDGRPR